MLKAPACLMASLLLVLSGCTSVRTAPERLAGMEHMSFEVVSTAGLDEYGRPVFGRKLDKRPSEPGSLFAILARDKQGKARRSYIVAVTKPEGPDIARPFNVLYRWTGKGFKKAGNLLRNIFTGEPCYECKEAAELYLLVAATGVTILIAGGVVLGIADGTWEAGKEMGKLLVKGEEVLASFSTYEYDGKGRVHRIRSYIPGDPPEEIISTIFTYKGDSGTPVETLTRSLIDGTKHTQVFGQ
jgi:hypothetical protein